MRLFKDDRGIAMVTAMLVTLVVTSLAATGFTIATHNSEQSGNDRRRVDAIAAAEAGIDAYLQYVATAPTTGTACSLPNGTLTASPPATYVVSATYYSSTATPTQIPCAGGVLTGATPPGAILVHSVGTAGGRSRTMEAWYGLIANASFTPAFKGAVYSWQDAVFSGGSAQFSSNSHNGDLYTQNGDINLSGSSLIDGVIEARSGNVTLSGSAQGLSNVTAYSTLATSGGVIIWGNGRSSNGANNNGAIIKGTEYWCSSKQGTGLLGTTKDCNSALPTDRGVFPRFDYPTFVTDATSGPLDVGDGPYAAPHVFTDCTSAKNYINTAPTGSNIVYVSANCTLTWGGGTVPVAGNLAIVTVGPFSLTGGTDFAPSIPNSGFHLRIEAMVNATAGTCSNTHGIDFSGGSTTGSGDIAMIYTPCLANFSGGSFSGTGSVIAGNVNFSGGSSLAAVPMWNGGTSTPGTGFTEKFQYRREII